MNTKLIIGFLIGAAVIGFLLDARRKRVQERVASNDEQIIFRPAVEPPTGRGSVVPDLPPLDFTGAMT